MVQLTISPDVKCMASYNESPDYRDFFEVTGGYDVDDLTRPVPPTALRILLENLKILKRAAMIFLGVALLINLVIIGLAVWSAFIHVVIPVNWVTGVAGVGTNGIGAYCLRVLNTATTQLNELRLFEDMVELASHYSDETKRDNAISDLLTRAPFDLQGSVCLGKRNGGDKKS